MRLAAGQHDMAAFRPGVVQSLDEAECRAVGRPQATADVHAALRALRDAAPATVNVDLMYGLPGQSAASWSATLAGVLAYRPEEVYLYPLYVRPLTTLGRRGAPSFDAVRIALYEQGRATLLAAGYAQVSLRMFRQVAAGHAPGPVYRCQDDGMLGLGCGARSYTRGVHYASEWAVGARGVRGIIDRWIQRPDAELAVADHGFMLDADEQRRRWLILSLLSDPGLDLAAYRARFGGDALADFAELAALAPRGLATLTADHLALTPAGHARADALGPWLYSAPVRARMAEYALQ